MKIITVHGTIDDVIHLAGTRWIDLGLEGHNPILQWDDSSHNCSQEVEVYTNVGVDGQEDTLRIAVLWDSP